MPPSKAAQKKAAEKEARLEPGEIVIRVQATEETLSRIWALMMFAEAPFKRERPTPALLPYEEESHADLTAKQLAVQPQLEVDWEEVRRGIVKRLGTYVATHGQDQAREVIRSFGGETLRQVPQEQLMGLFDALV